jgi:hypothetical protein
MCRGQEGKVRKKLVVQTSQNNDSYFFALSKCPKKTLFGLEWGRLILPASGCIK